MLHARLHLIKVNSNNIDESLMSHWKLKEMHRFFIYCSASLSFASVSFTCIVLFHCLSLRSQQLLEKDFSAPHRPGGSEI